MKTVALHDAAKITMGMAPPGSSYNTEGVGMPMIAGAGDYGDINPKPKKWTTEPNRVAEFGDIIVCVRATIGDLNWADKEYCLGRGVAGVRPYADQLDTRYASHYISTKKAELSKLGTGSTFLAIRRGDLERFPIPLPPLTEQKRIAAILDAADALRAKRREALAQLDTLLQSTFLDMFGDPVTNPMGWEEITVADLCEVPDDVRCGPFGTQLQQHEFAESGVPLWGIKHVNAGFSFRTDEFVSTEKARQLSAYSIMSGDLVMTRKGTIGNCHIYPETLEPGIMHSDLLRLRVSSDKADAQFISSQFAYSRRIQRQLELMSPGAVMPGINVTKLKSLLVESPPADLQRRFATIVKSVEQQKARMRTHLTELDALFASLQSRAFNGEL